MTSMTILKTTTITMFCIKFNTAHLWARGKEGTVHVFPTVVMVKHALITFYLLDGIQQFFKGLHLC